MSKIINKDEEVKQNYAVFKEKLPLLIVKYGYGKFVLMKNKKIIEVFDTKEDAVKAGQLKFDDNLFSVQEITDIYSDLGFYSHVICHQ